MFDRECSKLKDVTKHAVDVARDNGFEPQLLSDKQTKEYIDLHFKTLSPHREGSKMSGTIPTQKSQRALHE